MKTRKGGWPGWCALGLLASVLAPGACGAGFDAAREFRGVWVKTAYNKSAGDADWPSTPGMGSTAAIAEMTTILDRVQDLKCNVVVLQVRGFGERLYTEPGSSEPWPAWLGDQDQWEPLGEWVFACHRRGLELHVWINPFRFSYDPAPGGWPATQPYNVQWPAVPGHPQSPSRSTPYWFPDYKDKGVRDKVEGVVEKLLDMKWRWANGHAVPKLSVPHREREGQPGEEHGKEQDKGTGDDGVDGIVVDHYVPPPPDGGQYPQTKDWRTATVSPEGAAALLDMVSRAYAAAEVRGRRFGISPQSDQMPVAGPWMVTPWYHYMAVEIYKQKHQQDFEDELEPWMDANDGNPRSIVVPVLGEYKALGPQGWPASLFQEQIEGARHKLGQHPNGNKARGGGQMHYSMTALTAANGVGDQVLKQEYKDRQLVPAMSASLMAVPGDKPTAPMWDPATRVLKLPQWTPPEAVWWWEVWERKGGNGTPYDLNDMLPPGTASLTVPGGVQGVVLRPVYRMSREGTVTDEVDSSQH